MAKVKDDDLFISPDAGAFSGFSQDTTIICDIYRRLTDYDVAHLMRFKNVIITQDLDNTIDRIIGSKFENANKSVNIFYAAKLENCPKCGSEVNWNADNKPWHIVCKHCGNKSENANLEPTSLYNIVDEWNRKAKE